MPKKPELLAPAGDFEKLRMAVAYGADAVYLGGSAFSMRRSAGGFAGRELAQAVGYAHASGVRVYLTANTLPRCDELAALPGFFEQAAQAGVDALIVSDLGVLECARRYAPGVELHVSTQAGVVNDAAARALYDLGARRVILARELSLREIRLICERTPSGLAVETFVHGAMCVSFSGRCLLSDYLAARDANRGDCAQPCRWRYALVEERRPGAFFPVCEDERGTTILNARDLCMIGHLPELAQAGVDSFKIEGRAKSAYYVAAVTNAYRLALDAAADTARLERELRKVAGRGYCTGFYFGPVRGGQVYGEEPRGEWEFTAVIRSAVIRSAVVQSDAGRDVPDGCVGIEARASFAEGEEAELLEPGALGTPLRIGRLYDGRGARLRRAARPGECLLMESGRPIAPYAVLRRPCRP